MNTSWSKWLQLLAAGAVLSGCQLVLNVDAHQCDKDQTCVGLLGRGYTCGSAGVCIPPEEKTDAGASDTKPTLPTRWACIGKAAPNFVPDPDKSIRVRMDAVDFSTLRVPQGLTAKVCNPVDVDCTEPLSKDVGPGADGFFEFDVPYGFEGFLEFGAPNIVPSLLYRSRAYIESTTTSGPALASFATLEDISKHAGRPADLSKGVAILEIRDCLDGAGDGVYFDPVDGEEPFYFEGALPARGLSATTISNVLGANREPRAVGGFSGLTPGYKTFQVRLASTQDPVGRVTLQIRAAHITYVRVYPGD